MSFLSKLQTKYKITSGKHPDDFMRRLQEIERAFAPEITKTKMADLEKAWHRGNNAGKGYAVGNEKDTPKEACKSEGWKILSAEYDICIAKKPDGTLVGVGDAHGPWAVDLA